MMAPAIDEDLATTGRRALAVAGRRAAELMAGLPEPGRRTAPQRAAAVDAETALREAGERFLAPRVDAVYAELTRDGAAHLTLAELMTAAAQAFPGLVPTPSELARERVGTQADKVGAEMRQGQFFRLVLDSPAAGTHLLDSMSRSGAEALRRLPEFERTGRCELRSVTIERRDGAAYLTFTRPDCLNAEDDGQVADMEVAVDLAHLDRQVRVGVLRGGVMTHSRYQGRRVFSAGINLKALHAGQISFVDFILRRELGYISKLARGVRIDDGQPARQLPWIGAVDSFAIGGGAQLLLVLDLIVAAADSYLSLPAGQEGIIPGASNFRLVRAVPAAVARQLLLHGRRIWAHEPDARYLVDRVVDPAGMDREVVDCVALLDHGAVQANRRMYKLAAEPVDEFRRYMAEFAWQQSRRLYDDEVLGKAGRFVARSRS
jgi:thioesterase DpgC